MDRRIGDALGGRLMWLVSLFSVALVFVIGVTLVERSVPILSSRSLIGLLTTSAWNPTRGEFGLFPFIMGTFMVTGLTLALACPVCLLTAIYLAEYAPRRIHGIIKPAVDVLAGIPSVIFGLWGVLFVVPLIRGYAAAFAGIEITGYSVLAGAVVLSIMVSPILISISEEVITAVPLQLREASSALGATTWQTTKHVVLRKALPGIAAAIVLAFGRAFGETIAVLMVVGNVARVPVSVLDPAYPIPALIANDYGEMLSIPLYESALLLAALILVVVISTFNIAARVILAKLEG
ncbi:MAG TPA: phosphate ABC transporter permease subunit PstC [Candidatus Dormibacteraeota bacterium]|nr:phosphate ABC transporter permease subunit PstC [Candidatus Dormibacteraeota bacterium]